MKDSIENAVIITGASSGIGLALARRLLDPANHVVCISRRINQALIAEAGSSGVLIDYLEIDLSVPGELESNLAGFLETMVSRGYNGIALVNNAGILAPIAPLGRADSQGLAAIMNVNATSPIILMNLFARYFGGIPADKRIINISSGAAVNPYSGWSGYCSSKAALEMARRCLHTEQLNSPHPVKIMSFAPGVVDTDMQDEIRRTDPEDFPLVNRFREFKDKGVLTTPDFVAQRLAELLFSPDFPDGTAVDIRD